MPEASEIIFVSYYLIELQIGFLPGDSVLP
jgi:hypothetical protein